MQATNRYATAPAGPLVRIGRNSIAGRLRGVARRYWRQGGWLSFAIALGSALLIGAIWVATLERMAYERDDAMADARRQNSNLVLTLEAHTVRTLKSVEQALAQVVREWGEEGMKLDLAQFIRDGAIDGSILHNVGVLDERGDVRLNSLPFEPMNAQDREYFRVHRERRDGGMYLGVPAVGRVSGKWSLHASLRIDKPDGTFGGVAFATLDPLYFTRLYEQASLGKNDLITIVGLDGITRARYTGNNHSSGQDRTGGTLFKLAQAAPVGSFVSKGQLEGISRITSYRRLKDFPLIVAIGVSLQDALAQSRERQRAYYIGAGTASATILLFAGLLMVALARQRRTRRDLEVRNTVLATQQDTSPDAILLVDEDARIVSYNRRFVELWDIPEAMVRAGDDEPVLRRVVEQMADTDQFFARVRYLYEHREERASDVLRTRDGRTIDRYSAPVINAGGTYHGRIWFFRDVTERVRGEDQLRNSEARFRQMANAMGDTFWMAPPDLSSIHYVSPAFEKIWGRSCADLRANPRLWLESVHVDDVPLVKRVLDELARGKSYDIEFRIIRPDGVQRWINDRGYPIRDEAERVVLTTGVASDITEAKSAEATIRTRENQRQAILDSIPDIAWLKDTESRFLAVNEALARLCNLPAPAILGKSDRDFFPEDLARKYREDDLEVMRTGGHKVVEERIVGADGSERVIETLKTRVCDASGSVIGTAGIARDITDRRRSEEELRLSAKAFASIADGILVTDATRRIVSVNEAFCSITGYGAEEVLGKTPKVLGSGRHDDAFYKAMWEEIGRSAHWKGEIWDKRKNGEIYPALLSISAVKDASGTVTHYVGVSTDISSLKQYEQKLHHQAHHDALTGLPNRVLFQDRFRETLGRARRHGLQAAVLFLDLDRFKVINDSLGHSIGDSLLQAAARRLAECVREVDTVARFGGDEFAVLLDTIEDSQNAALVARKLVDAMARPFQLGEHQLYVSVSIGISCYPQDGADAEALFKNADTAMYRAKAEGRNNFQFFSAEMNAQALENLQMTNHLRRALERNELELHYQPRLDLKTGRVSGAEALVRWRHPALGLIPPARFIPLAEETGLIEPIGEWVMRAACKQMRAWQDAGLPLPRLAVNLSARQFRDPNLLQRTAGILEETRLPAHHLELEVTESMVMQDPESATGVLSRLRAMGIGIAIDDFGTGYSSLSYLKRFPIDFLKIDRSFVSGVPQDADDAAIIRAIIALATSLNLRLIAEGVETAEQRDFLAANGCHEGQGYFFAKPAPAAEIEGLLRPTSISLVAA